jgi:broad specificity phosphatase PhoE
MRILLIRHGNTDLLGRVLYGRMPGVHLNAQGCRQAQVLGQNLKERYRIHEVISSPLERALETARFIADPHGLNVSIDEGINEVDVGSWMGKSFDELLESDEWKRYNKARSTTKPPGGELIMEVQTRAWGALARILARYHSVKDATAAVVSHGDVVRALLILFLGMPLDHIHRLEVAPASLSEVSLGAGHPRVLMINQVFESDSAGSIRNP